MYCLALRNLLSVWLVAGLFVSSPAWGAQLQEEAPTDFVGYLAGSTVSYRNSMATRSLAVGGELHYNPYYGMTVALAPQLALGEWLRWPSLAKHIYARGAFDITGELTHSDITTQPLLLSDVTLALGAAELYRVPYVGADLSVEAAVGMPSSLASQAEQRIAEGSLGLSAERAFKVRNGLTVGWDLTFGKDWSKTTTAGYAYALESRCAGGAAATCAPVAMHTGERNVDWLVDTGLSAKLDVFEWLSLRAAASLTQAWLYALPADQRISLSPTDATSKRYFTTALVAVTVKPQPLYSVVAGLRSLHEQLAPDGTYRLPLFNRYTQFYVEARLDLSQAIHSTQRLFNHDAKEL